MKLISGYSLLSKSAVFFKQCLLTLILLSITHFNSSAQNAFAGNRAQDVVYEVHGLYTRTIIKSKLKSARSLRDIIENFPKDWINGYNSVEIKSTCNGLSKTSSGLNELLNKEQQAILSAADMGTDVIIDVSYKQKDIVTNKIENKKMHVVMTVIAEKEAQFEGGYKELISYLKVSCANKVPQVTNGQVKGTKIRFTINEKGETTSAKIIQEWGEPKIDEALMDAIKKMPLWKAAEGENGVKMKQEFELSVGSANGC